MHSPLKIIRYRKYTSAKKTEHGGVNGCEKLFKHLRSNMNFNLSNDS